VLNLLLPPESDGPLNLLCLGAHADDVEIGCGGSILRLLAERPSTKVCWIVFSGNDRREAEARRSAAAFLGCSSAAARIEIFGFRDGYFPFCGAELKDRFEELKQQFQPSLIFTHYRNDAHQDHRMIAELTHCTFRNHLVLEYEIPKYDGDLGNPNIFLPLGREHVFRKVELLLSHFVSQAARQWFDEATFLAMARLRGVGCNATTGFAEAFYSSKLVI